MTKFGIDVSKWQGANFDFARAKREDKIEFVILRGAYSCPAVKSTGGKDTQFENYYKKCKALNLPVGIYQYSMAVTVDQAKKEAEYLYNNVLKGKKFEYPIYIDIEDKVQLALSKTLLTDIAITWCEYLSKKGYFVGIYAGKYTFSGNLDDSRLKSYTHWVPMWGKTCTYEDKSVLGMWQFGGETNVIRKNTIAGVVCDQNYAYVDFPAVIRAKGFNGYTTIPQIQTPVKTAYSASQIASAKRTVQAKAGLEDQTIEYLMKYKYGNDLIMKLAKAME